MTSTLRTTTLLGSVLLLNACGMRFGDTPMNQGLPDVLKARTVWKDPSIFQYKPTELVGCVLYHDPATGNYSIKRQILADKYVPALEKIDAKDGVLFHSLVDASAALQGSYLAFAASIASKITVDVTIADSALSFISWSDVPEEKLVQEANTEQPAGGRFWVQAVLISHVIKESYNESKADASGVVGTALGAKGNVYVSTGARTNEPSIALLLVDLDKYVTATNRKKAIEAGASRQERIEGILKESRVVPAPGKLSRAQ